ncbi:MAG: response regulator [Bacteroidota bacterium]|nr:response regulator [Bacteroidota bacterium]
MYQLKIGVIEDEMVIADTICLTLRKLGYSITPTSPNYNRALKMVEEEKPDLLLIDINLGGGKDGIDVAEYVREKYAIPLIFLTANSDTATIERAKKVKPNAYLVKPFTKNDLYAAIEIAVSSFSQNSSQSLDSIMVKEGYDYIKVFLYEIVFIQSDQNYAVLELKNGKKIMVRSTISEMLEKLPSEKFKKINRGTIINTQHISVIKTDRVIVGETEFSINKTKREDLLNVLNKVN